ncbi:MAG: DASH family cryptochrome [Spirochaetaceae bacterium]|nr:MAG: DASH family cryptochrome [Spirochaetaceae bacterium]
MRRHLIWFRNDLRTTDHRALSAIAASDDEVLPVMIIPPHVYGTTSFGLRRVGRFRARFLVETLSELDANLARIGARLLVTTGDPARVIADLCARYTVTDLWAEDAAGTEEAADLKRVEVEITRLGSPPRVHRTYATTLLHPDDLPFPADKVPFVFSDFRRAVERSWCVRPAAPPPTDGSIRAPAQWPPEPGWTDAARDGVPTVEELSGSRPTDDPRAVMRWRGGERAAAERLGGWVWERDAIARYKETRNGLVGADYSSKLSPWLANGALSARVVYEEIRRYEALRVRNESTYWMVFELLWRDYFVLVARRFGGRLFARSGPRGVDRPWRADADAFTRWCTGRTGNDFVDANMREIAATGYMSNRGRQNVASYLAHDLQLDWRMGAEYFESELIDYDPASNYGNWTYVAGVGTDPRQDRVFKPDLQAARYDADGAYRALWHE